MYYKKPSLDQHPQRAAESCGYSEDSMIAIRDGEHQLLTDMNMELDSRNNVAHSILHREEGQ